MRRFFLFLACLIGLCIDTIADPVRLTYPAPMSEKDVRYAYVISLLRLVLDKSGGDYELLPFPVSMTQSRVIEELKQGDRLDVAWLQTSLTRESELLPVRIPIYQGYIGWRLLLIRSGEQGLFDTITTLADLSKLTVGLGHDWPDVTIMSEAGLPVGKIVNYDAIFRLLAMRRVDYLSRSVLEIGLEARENGSQGLVIEKGLMLHYPGAFYFFFSPRRPDLAERVRRGLLRAIGDGSFEQLFQAHWSRILDEAQLDKRRIISLKNPLFPGTPPEIPLRTPPKK